MTDAILSAVHHLIREGGPFVMALTHTRHAPTAIARALETIRADIQASESGERSISRLEALFRTRLAEGLKHGDLPAHADVDDLSAFFASIVVSLIVEALGGGDADRLATIRQVAMTVLLEADSRAHVA